MNPGKRLVLLVCAAMAAHPAQAQDPVPRERLSLDSGWRFHLGDDWGSGQSLAKAGTGTGPASDWYSVASWRPVNLPHDWAIELPFDPKADPGHGFKPVGEGFPQNSTGWYRRTFELPASDSGRRIWLEFDGIYRDATVFVNGWFAAHNESGYSGFRCDITDVARIGAVNTVAVKVDASQPEGWFYEGAGIYRHVWLVETAPVAVAPDGITVTCSFDGAAPVGLAELHLEARVVNSGTVPADARVSWEIFAPDGRTQMEGGRTGATLNPSAWCDFRATMPVPKPLLWSPEAPNLYRLVATVTSGGRVVDRVDTPFGIRTVGFDANRGFILNGEPYRLKGTSNHQDHAGVGSALPDALQYFRIQRLKEMGCNAYRTAHNPPTPELLDACDRLGMLVMDENRLLGSDKLHMDRFEAQIRRDRNHPSVAIWSLGNEEFTVEETPAGGRVAAAMQALVKRLDPTRPVTFNAPVGNEYAGVNEVVEVRGWSYHPGPEMDAYHAAHPLQPNVGSEQGSTVSTRGIYANDPLRGYVSAYDDNAPPWAQTAETWMTFFATRPWLSGGFVWTGFDYRGEPTPYGWPCINSHFGIMDTCGFPKDNFWYYKAWWTSPPVLHLLPHWNWAGREGQAIDVRALSNCDEVELFLNGRSLGRHAIKPESDFRWKVPFEPGALTATGYRAGKAVAEASVETTGEPASVNLLPDRASIAGDGADLSVFTVSILDAKGRVVPVAGNQVNFSVEGPGRILGVGNGDPSCHEPDTVVSEPSFRTAQVGGWKSRSVADPYGKDLPEEGAAFDDSAWDAASATGDEGQFASRGRGIVRGHFTVAARDLESPVVELWFGRIAGGIAVYVNGHYAGATCDPRVVSVYDVKALLHPGENVVAVAAANYDLVPAGISKGVWLRMQDDPPVPAWSRSAFNGLAQVIVQSSGGAGEIRLTARSEGLAPATFVVRAGPAR